MQALRAGVGGGWGDSDAGSGQRFPPSGPMPHSRHRETPRRSAGLAAEQAAVPRSGWRGWAREGHTAVVARRGLCRSRGRGEERGDGGATFWRRAGWL